MFSYPSLSSREIRKCVRDFCSCTRRVISAMLLLIFTVLGAQKQCKNASSVLARLSSKTFLVINLTLGLSGRVFSGFSVSVLITSRLIVSPYSMINRSTPTPLYIMMGTQENKTRGFNFI